MPDGFSLADATNDDPEYHYEAAGKQYNVDPDLLRAVHGVEDPRNDPKAVSPQGAEGWMQIMPPTARHLGVTDTSSPVQSIYGAAKYLREMTDTFGGNRDMGVAAYHGGPDTTNWGPRTSAYLDSVANGYAQRKARRQAVQVQEPAAQPFSLQDALGQTSQPSAQPFSLEDALKQPIIPETGGRPLSNRRAVIDLPMAQTEGQPAAPPAVGPGQGTFGGKGTIDPLSGAELPPPGTSSDLGQPRTAAATEVIRARGADTSLDRVLGAAKEAWNNTEFLTPMAQEWADKHGLGGDARVVGTALAAFNAAFQGGVQAAYETARGLGLPDTLARDIGGMAESLGMTGAPHGALPHDVTRAPPEPVASPTIRQGVADMESAARGEPAPAAAPPPAPEQPPAAPTPVAELQSIAIGAPPSGSALPTLQAMAAEAKPWDQTPPAERAEIAKKAGVDPTVANWPLASLSPETQAALQASMTPPPPAPPGTPAQPPPLPPARFEPPPPSPPGAAPEAPRPQAYPSPEGLPPIHEGHVRIYHGGDNPASGGGRWVTPDYAYARDYRPGQSVHYADVPIDHPDVQRALEPGRAAVEGTNMPAPISTFEAPEEIAKQLKPVSPAAETPAQVPAQPSAQTHAAGEAPYVMLDPEQLTLDPKRFQYKEADEQGRTGALAGTARWEPDLAQPITAWQGNDGNTYVVNGHQRTNRALQAKAEGQPDVQVPTRIYREADGFTPDYMRVLGAYQNIAEGSGTAMDAARILRSNVAIPEDRALPDLPPKSAMVQQGRSLAKLSDEAFGMVSNGLVPEGFAAHVGDLISDPREQMAALEVLSRAQPANSTQARIMVEDVRNSGFAKGTEAGLFGEEAFAKSLIPERARVLDTAMRVLRRGRGLFKAAVEGEETLTGAGNVLDTARNVAAKSANERLLDILDKNATTRGPVSDALSAAARELADGHAAGAVASRFLAAVREIERRTAQDGVRSRATAGGAGSPGAQGEGAAGVEQGQFARRPIEDPEVERKWQALLAQGEQQKREADAYAAQGKPARFFDPRYNLTYLISRDLNHPPNGWRQTFFRDGQPTGHEEYNTASEAFLSVLRNGDAVQRIGPNHIEPEPPPQFARRPPRPQTSGAPLFGEPERERQEKPPAEHTIRTDPRQVDMFGKADAAVQAQAARDQAGRGALAPKAPQAKADDGLFAPKEDDQPSMFSRREEPPRVPLYSAVERATDALKQAKGSGQQMLAMLQKTPGVKPEEIKWLGLDEFLRNRPSVTKAEIQDFVRANSLDVREVLKGHGPGDFDSLFNKFSDAQEALRQQLPDKLPEPIGIRGVSVREGIVHALAMGWMKPEELPAQYRDAAQAYVDTHTAMTAAGESAPTKFGTYSLPGGENYREMLITLPVDTAADFKAKAERIAQLDQRLREINRRKMDVSTAPELEELNRQARNTMTQMEMVRSERNSRTAYQSAHWDEPNVMAHIRFDERTAPDGARVLLMDEAQSDWHQRGRKTGYNDPARPWEVYDAGSRTVISRHADMEDARSVAMAGAAEGKDYRYERGNILGAPPDAPFRTTWPQLTMKRIIKWAVDNGFDRVAWTPGDVQAARYDLSKQISALDYQKNADGTYKLSFQKDGRGHMIGKAIPADKLEDHVGKDVAQRIVDGAGDKKNFAGNQAPRDEWSRLSGLDLKVGGEGMKGFYDRMLPTETQKIVGKFGAKVGRSEVATGKPERDTLKPDDLAQREHNAEWQRLVSERTAAAVRAQAEGFFGADPQLQAVDRQMDALHARMVDETLARSQTTQAVHSFDISPELRRAVQTEGLPLFAKRAGEEAPREIDAQARERLATAAQRIMREAGLPPSVGLRLVDRIAAGDGTADGKYTRSMIELALDTPPEQIAAKLFHEVVHGLTDTRLGLLRPGERAVLYRAADRWLERDGNRASLERAGYGQAELRDEAVARMGEDALKRGLQPPEPYNRMTRFLERTGSLLRGEGFRTADDVFDSVLRGEKRQTAQEGAGPGVEGFARRPVAGPPATTTTPAGPIQRTADAVLHAAKEVTRSIADGLAPMQGGSGRAQAFAGTFANALRKVQYRFGQIDKEIERNFTADERRTMGTKLDAQSAFEQQVRDLPPDQQAAARTQFDASGEGLASLPANQRQVIDMLDRISQDTWRQMQERGMVDPNARGLPYYFPRQILRWTEAEGFTRPGGAGAGTGRGLDERGRNLTTAGPMERKHLTAEETEAAAKAKLGQDVAILRDIRSLPARLAFSHRAMAGVDLMNAIERVGKDTGVDLVVRGDIPGMLKPGEFFTMADHPSFRRWTGSGWQAIHVVKEFEGPLKAVLTKPSPTWYRAAQGLKGGVMTSIMISPFIHLAVELGRSLPVMPLKVLTLQALRDGSVLRRDLGYMDQAITDGLAPLGQGWHVDPVSIADQANVEGRNGFIRAITGMRDAVANGAKTIGGQFLHDVVQHPHQALLWDQVFNLQVGIYDTMRQRNIDKGFAPDVAGTMAAQIANRYAGALPPEHLGRAANMAANLLLFSRSFTLGNLGVMKDMLTGAPSHILARIEQMAGPEVAKSAQSAMRRKAIAAFTMDIGLFYLANGLLQAGLQVLRQTPTLGLPAAAQQIYQDWLDKAGSAVSGMADNPLSIFGVLPQHWNEPGKQDRVYAGTDSQGRAIYLRLPPGKVGEEFVGWFSRPGTMIENKLSPLVRPIIESIFGKDTLGRDIYKPNPETLGDHLRIAGAVVKHIGEGLGPTALIQGISELVHQHILGEKTQADPYVSAMKVLGPLTGAAQISQGFPGGQAAGEMHAQTEREKYDLQKALPDIRDKIRKGDVDGAIADMRELRVPPGLMRYYIRQTMHPGPSSGTLRRLPGEPAGIRERVERQLGTQP